MMNIIGNFTKKCRSMPVVQDSKLDISKRIVNRDQSPHQETNGLLKPDDPC